MSGLRDMKCVPCRRDMPPLDQVQIASLMPEVPEWQVLDVEGVFRLQRVFKFKDFNEALAFTNRVGALAETENHHPAILTEWGRVTVTWWTHAIRGLHQNDFIMAARTDALYD